MEEGTLPGTGTGTMFGLARRSFLKGHLPTFGVQPPTHAPLQAAGDPTLRSITVHARNLE